MRQQGDIESYLVPRVGIYKLYKWYKLCKTAKALSKLTPSQLRNIRKYERIIAKHHSKIAEYIKDPIKFDNKGFPKNAPNDAIRQKIIQRRINHLQQEIKTFKKNIEKIINGQ